MKERTLYRHKYGSSLGAANRSHSVEDKQPVQGMLEILAHDKDGVLLWKREPSENLVVTQGRSALMKLLAGDGSPDYVVTHMNWADEGHDPLDPIHTLPGMPDPSDTAFNGTEVVAAPGKPVTFSYPDGDYPTGTRVRFEAALELLEGNGPGAQAISEAGLFMGGGDMFAYKTFGLITKTAEFSLTFRWTIVF